MSEEGIKLMKDYMKKNRWKKKDFAKECGYLSQEKHSELTGLCVEIGKMLGAMINNPAPFLISDLCRLTSDVCSLISDL